MSITLLKSRFARTQKVYIFVALFKKAIKRYRKILFLSGF